MENNTKTQDPNLAKTKTQMQPSVSQQNKQNQLKSRLKPEQNQQQQLKSLAPRQSIQDAFKKFQKEKFYQLKLNKYLKNVQVDRTSPQFKQQLRDKLLETAQKYIGVPYGKKFHQPGDPLYDAPLFLDCCALVRQCIFDLRQDFGYTLAKWNQSYQFDLLPDQNLTQEQLKPGDLIFYSATYRNPKLKPFPHKMVHVEIYMGQGKSIGARWQKGTIKVFDSYKFESTLYYDIEYHFRSIDAWLEGKFQSHCAEHKWLDERANEWLSDKFSVFADPALDDMDIVETGGNIQSQNDKQTKQVVKNIMVGKGNNSKLVQQYFTQKGPTHYKIMPQKDVFSPHFYYKWVQSTGQVDFYSFKEGKQLVNHIPNIGVISSKLQLLKTLKQFQLDLQSKSLPQTMKLAQFIPKTYRLDVMSDEIEFLNDQTEGIWIYKPRNMNQAKGIRMISNVKEFKRQFIQSKKFYLGEYSLNNMIYYKPEMDPTVRNGNSCSKSEVNVQQKNHQNNTNEGDTKPLSQFESTSTQISNPTISSINYSDLKHDGLIQHYISPLLLKGRKFDIRCYMFVYSNPSIVLYNQGYLRLCIDPYTQEDIQSQANLMVHLTNNSLQHKHKDYKAKKQSTIAGWELIQAEIGTEKTAELEHQIKRILVTTYSAARRKLMAKKGTYELLGCDIMIDSQCKPYLLQVNTNPAMFTDTQVQKALIPKLVRNTLNVALSLFEGKVAVPVTVNQNDGGKAIKQANYSGQEDLESIVGPAVVEYFANNARKYNYELLFCEQTGFYYNQDKQFQQQNDNKEKATEINGISLNVKKDVQKQQIEKSQTNAATVCQENINVTNKVDE